MRQLLPLAFLCLPAFASSQTVYNLTVDATAGRKPISPLIYGVAWATQAEIQDLRAPLNRMGGNSMSRYNWQLNADNRAQDWYFESIGDASSTPGERADTFIAGNRAGGAQTMMTIPMIGWVAKLGASRANLASFSVKKYGPQTATDPYMPDAGNGISTAVGNPFITGNNPNDANVASSSAFQQGWVSHLVSKWGPASQGGLKYYLMDNESSIWFSTHRDVHPVGAKMDEILNDILTYGSMVKSVDPSALVVGPEEWGWSSYLLSGYDQQYGSLHGWNLHPDKDAHSGMDYTPYLLQQIHAHDVAAHKRTLDVFSLHYYPQDGSFSDDVSAAAQALRNRDTRSLWDPTYTDPSWINSVVQLIPRMKQYVASYYPGTQVAVTEYNWGAEGNINGATAQADVLGIFGQQGLDIATRWTCPDPSTPTYKAMKMFRSYDGHARGFGDLAVSDAGASPDSLSSFAAYRSSDGALTVFAINKVGTPAKVNLAIKNFTGDGLAQVWQLTSANAIARIADVPVANNVVSTTVPGQSITLFVLPPSSQVVAKPGIPTSFTGRGLDRQAVLTWAMNGDAMSYTLLRSTDGGSTYTTAATTTSTTFTDGGLTDGKACYYKVFASNSVGSSLPTSPIAVVPAAPKADSAQYNFESGVQGWQSSGGLITSVAQSYAKPYLGSYSLAVNISATGNDAQTVSVSAPTTPAGSTVTFHIWLPAGCALDSIQPYVLQGASGGWTWSGSWTAVSSLTSGGWNTITVKVPANAAVPLYTLGVQFNSSGAWSGTCYIDSVSW